MYQEELNKHDKVCFLNATVSYELWLRNNRKIDLDGCIFVKKFFQDTLVENGWLVDDTCDILTKNTEVYGGIDKDAEYTYFKVKITGLIK